MTEGWREFTFATLIECGALQIGDGYRAKNEELGGTGPMFLRAGHVRDTHIDFADVERFHSELEQTVASKMSRPRDVIVTTKGNSTGRVAYVGADLPPFVYSPHLSYWRATDAEVLIPGFLRYWSRSRHFREQLTGFAASTDMAPYLSLVDQRRLRIVLPPSAVQQSIADMLGTLDDKIELNRRMNETLEAMARALFKSWFVDFDPVRAKAQGRKPAGLDPDTAKLFPKEFVDSDLGEIPKGWKTTPLYEIATYVNGAAYKVFDPNDDRRGLPIIKIAELKAGVTDQTRFSDVDMPEKYRVENGDILFSWSGNPDTSIDTFVWCEGPAWLNQHIFRVVPHRKEERAFVFSTLKHLRPTFAEIARNKQTTGLGHVTAEDMKRLLVAYPDDRVLWGWTEAVRGILDRVFANEVENRNLAALRDALLPRLLSGELRVRSTMHLLESQA